MRPSRRVGRGRGRFISRNYMAGNVKTRAEAGRKRKAEAGLPPSAREHSGALRTSPARRAPRDPTTAEESSTSRHRRVVGRWVARRRLGGAEAEGGGSGSASAGFRLPPGGSGAAEGGSGSARRKRRRKPHRSGGRRKRGGKHPSPREFRLGQR